MPITYHFLPPSLYCIYCCWEVSWNAISIAYYFILLFIVFLSYHNNRRQILKSQESNEKEKWQNGLRMKWDVVAHCNFNIKSQIHILHDWIFKMTLFIQHNECVRCTFLNCLKLQWKHVNLEISHFTKNKMLDTFCSNVLTPDPNGDRLMLNKTLNFTDCLNTRNLFYSRLYGVSNVPLSLYIFANGFT